MPYHNTESTGRATASSDRPLAALILTAGLPALVAGTQAALAGDAGP